MLSMIETPRLFVPHPTGYTIQCRTYGIKVLGYDTDKYDLYSALPNSERLTADDLEFYEFVSFYYSMNLDFAPKKRPYVQYVDFMRARGGGITATDAGAIEYLKQNCNTLIIPNADERDFLEHMRANSIRKNIGAFMFDYEKPIPSRFVGNNYATEVFSRFGIRAGR